MITVGSIESSDIKLQFDSNNLSLRVHNMVKELDEAFVTEVIVAILQEFHLLSYHPTVYFNGANEWVIRSRCEVARMLLEQAYPREGSAQQ